MRFIAQSQPFRDDSNEHCFYTSASRYVTYTYGYLFMYLLLIINFAALMFTYIDVSSWFWISS